jgi:RNA polymerase sigma-70 factor (ECF subfamily)
MMSAMSTWDELVAALTDGSDDTQALAAALATLFDAGHARWSDIELVREDFAAHVLLRLPPDGDRVEYVRSLVGADLYLACACVHHLPGALEAFDAHYLARVPQFVASIDGSEQFSDEVRQILRERLLLPRDRAPPRIADYSGRGALMVWLRVSAKRAALNLRQQPAEARRRDHAPLIDDLADDASPELQLFRERYAGAFATALRRALATMAEEERMVLRLFFVAGESTERIAALMRMSRSTAGRRLVSARQSVYELTRRFLGELYPVDSAEFQSLARGLHDGLNVSLSSLLAPADDPEQAS